MSKKIYNKRKRKMALDSKESDDDDDENGEDKSLSRKKKRKPFILKDISTIDSEIKREVLDAAFSKHFVEDKNISTLKNESNIIEDDELCDEQQDIFKELYDNHDVNKPFDLSLKSKTNCLEITVDTDLSLRQPNDENPGSSEDEDECNKQALIDSNTTVPQELILAHFSKIQQNFVANLLQYQAAFLAHYQQIHQHMISKSGDSTDVVDEEVSSNADEKEKCDRIDSDQESKSDSPEFQSGQGILSTPNILQSLVPFILYPNLLQVTSASGSLQPGANSSNTLSNAAPTISSQENENEQDISDELSTLKEHLIKYSRESIQLKTHSSSVNKYSVLGTLIGASNEKSFTSSYNDNELSEEIENSTANLQNKRKRIAFSAKQYELLQTTFEHNNFPEPADQQCIARQLKAPYRSIKMWFQNKRANARKKLLPGEKGSGRTPAGEKIPGDTDTRFYCDKCPSAFICQIFLSNHLHAHTLYTKSCHKCRVTFTHDCLLTTHTIAKCGKKEDKTSEDLKENDNGVLDLKFLTKLKSVKEREIKGNSTFPKGKDFSSAISSTILSQLKSTLPLLTLLQIQKKQEEQNRDESVEEMENDNDSTEPCGNVSQNDHNDSESSDEDKLEIDEYNETEVDVKVEEKGIPKDLPPLIPTEFVTSENGNSSKFAILRQLLTNYHPNNVYNKKNQEKEIETENVGEKSNEINSEVDRFSNHKLPQNIPEHLYQLLDDQMDLSQSSKPNENNQKAVKIEETESMEADINHVNILKENPVSIEKRKIYNDGHESSPETKFVRGPKAKRLRRRTTVFTENQHRILYLHFTHCNFPDPAMFRILSKLTGLTPHVIKIWFQNERSRQRRQVTASEEVIKEKKPYKCRDCGVEFAMPAFLVKHCMRHIPTDNVTSQARKCPICMVEFETQKLHSHFMASHNLSVTMEDDSASEKNICHLCRDQFPDLNTLSIHKNEHLKDTHYGDPPQCYECKTTFVNVLCLEAHMATHDKFMWEHSCLKCKMKFYDKILLESHLMTHSINNNNNNNNVDDLTNEAAMNRSQYLVSLAQQFASEAKLKPILPKETSQNSLSFRIKSTKSEDLIKSSVAEDANKESSSSLTTAPNVSFKLIPVKFIPVSSSNSANTSSSSSTVSNSHVTVISSPILSFKNEGEWKLEKPISNIDKPLFSDFVKIEDDTIFPTHKNEDFSEKYEKGLKKVPNLIPISDSFAFKPFDAVNGTAVSPIKSKNNCEEAINSQGMKTGDSSASSVSSDHDEANENSQLLYTPYASEYRKRRRTPTHFNSSQRDILEAYYKYDNFPDPNEQLHLSEYLQVPYSVIKTWFQNTRKNHRKHLKVSTTNEVGGPFECSECRVCFVSKIYIDSHLRQHQDKHPFQCNICSLQFPHIAIRDIHIKMGCSKKSKKKHEHIRQFSSVSLANKVPKERNGEVKEDCQSPEKITSINVTERKLSASSTCEKNFKFVCCKHNELINNNNVKCSEADEEANNLDFSSLTKAVENSEEGLSDASLSLSKEHTVISKIMSHKCVQCLTEFSSLNLLTAHVKKDHNNINGIGSYVPQIVGYTCPQCNQTFKSFLAIAEHKVNSVCLLQKHEYNTFQGKGSCKKVLLTYSKLFDLNKVPCSNLLPSNTLSPESSVDFNNMSNSITDFNNKKLDKLNCANSNFLKLHYKYNNFPSSKEISLMSKKLCIDRERVAHWFQKRRARERRGNAIVSTVLCQSCSSAFVHQEALNEHKQSVHNPSTICIQFICPVENCNMKYPNSTLLQTHQMSHEENKDIKNTDLKFQGGFLEAHYLENNFPTPMDVGFIARRLNVEPLCIHWWFKERRAKHIINLENKKRYKYKTLDGEVTFFKEEESPIAAKDCELCDAAFIDETLWQKHIQTHITDLSLVCYECGANFANPLVFETHMLHHGIITADDMFSLNKSINVKSVVKFKYNFLQLQVLWNHYRQNNVARKDEIKLLSRRLKMPMKHVQTWYKCQKSLEYPLSISSDICLKSSNINSSLSAKQNAENQYLKCSSCSAEFVSTQHLQCHTLVHKLSSSFSCDACSKIFCSEMIRDTHTLSHYTGLGLKARVQSLERELRTSLKKLVNDCKDAALFSVAESDVVLSNEDSLSGISDAFDDRIQCDNDFSKLDDSCQLDEICEHDHFNEPINSSFEHINSKVALPTKSNSHYDDFNDMSSILQIDHIDEDADVNTEDEDDELKLVIDE